MKLYLDDIRYPSQTYPNDSDWLLCRNAEMFKNAFENMKTEFTLISFDHDINDYDKNGVEITGYDCLKWLCDYIQDNELDISNLKLNFHTANPVGKENMQTYWQNFKNHYIKI